VKLAIAMVFAKDIERMTAFYRDGLGLVVLPAECQLGWVVFDTGGTRFALHAIPPHIAAEIGIAEPPMAREEGAIKLIFAAPDVEAACARLTAAGGLLLPARGGPSRDVLDPEGNVLRLTPG
jgi:catechol 2,3-dioxygenase-like lactoylglutathione lyase family enzyme